LAILFGQIVTFIPVGFLLTSAACALHTRLRGKFLVWNDLPDGLKLRADRAGSR
jgi:hypothetical protein